MQNGEDKMELTYHEGTTKESKMLPGVVSPTALDAVPQLRIAIAIRHRCSQDPQAWSNGLRGPRKMLPMHDLCPPDSACVSCCASQKLEVSYQIVLGLMSVTDSAYSTHLIDLKHKLQ